MKPRTIATPDGLFIYYKQSGLALVDSNKRTKEWYKPLYAQVAVTEKCNMNPPCPWCYLAASPVKTRAWVLCDLKKVISFLDKWGLFGVSYSGGEPFTYPPLPTLVKWTAKETGLDVSLTTNGLVSEKKIRQVEPYLGEIRMSVYFPDKLSLAKKFLHRQFDFGINLLIRRGTIPATRKIMKAAIKMGIRDFLINEFVVAGRGKQNPQLAPTAKEYSQLASLIKEFDGKATIRVNTRLLTILQRYKSFKGTPFNDRKQGRIIAITVDHQVKLSSLVEKGYSFSKPKEIPILYKKLLKEEKNHGGEN